MQAQRTNLGSPMRGDEGVPMGPTTGGEQAQATSTLRASGQWWQHQQPPNPHPGISILAQSLQPDQSTQKCHRITQLPPHRDRCPQGMGSHPRSKGSGPRSNPLPSGCCPPSRCENPPRLARTSLVCGTGCELGCHRCHQHSEPRCDAPGPAHPGHEQSLENALLGTINHQG